MILNYLKALKIEIIILIISISVASAVIWFSMQHWQESVQVNIKAGQRLNEAKRHYAEGLLRKSILEEYMPRYKNMERLNIAGKENRIDWIDLIDDIAGQEKIPYISYKIVKQVVDTNNEIRRKYSELDVYKSVMSLDMKLLHEGDLYTVINRLKSNAKGLFDVASCDIKKLRTNVKSIEDNKTGLNFSANCKLNWYSFQPKSI